MKQTSQDAAPAEIGSMTSGNTVGTTITRFNALRHGLLSQYTVLPWENAEQYRGLVEALVGEHSPDGPTEEHLVEELAGIVWRKRRLRLAEAAVFQRGLKDTLDPDQRVVEVALAHLELPDRSELVLDSLSASGSDTAADISEMEEIEAKAHRALKLLNSRREDAYEAAVAALRDDTRQWWLESLSVAPNQLGEEKNERGDEKGENDQGETEEVVEQPYTADISGLRQFLENEALPWFESQRIELENRPLIRQQAFGDAFVVEKLDRLGRYEVHLDRKLERTLTMLLRLKDLRQSRIGLRL